MNKSENQSQHAIDEAKHQFQMAEMTKQEIVIPPRPDNKNGLVYKFKQQLISAWRPVPSLSSSIILYFVLTAIFTTIGVVMFIFTSKQYQFQTRYDNQCTTYNNTPCSITIQVTEEVEAPIYFYYGLTNFNQNQRFFSNSKSKVQLQNGQQFSSVDAARKICGSKTTNGDMGWSMSVDGTSLNNDDIAFPCGLIAYSFFNDTFGMVRANDSTSVIISESGIAWPKDKSLYMNKDITIQGIDVTSQHWLVWLRPAATSSFYKLWGVINSKLQQGNYTITVQNNYQISFGQKWFKIAKSNVFGDNNIVLSIAYLACAGISLVMLMSFVIGKIKNQFK